MELETILYSILTSATITSIFIAWFKFRLQYSIKNEYDKNLEKFKSELEAKKKAELIAELLSEWLTFPKEQKHLNKLTFEAFLWLPDNIAKDLSNLLAHAEDSPNMRDVLLSVRKHLLNKESTLASNDIIIFMQEHTDKLCTKAVNMSNKNEETNNLP